MRTVDTQEATRLWESWARAGRHQARALARQGGLFDSSLKDARATTYEQAVTLLRANPDPAEAARLMMRIAAETHVRTPPLARFDTAALRYTVARTWQRCALMLDPSLAEVQPLWTAR